MKELLFFYYKQEYTIINKYTNKNNFTLVIFVYIYLLYI